MSEEKKVRTVEIYGALFQFLLQQSKHNPDYLDERCDQISMLIIFDLVKSDLCELGKGVEFTNGDLIYALKDAITKVLFKGSS